MKQEKKLRSVLFLLCCLLLPSAIQAKEKYLYARIDFNQLVFFGDWEPQYNDNIEGLVQFPESDTDQGSLPYWWDEAKKNVRSVRFDESCKDIVPVTSTAYMFAGFESLSSITGIENLNTESVTTMKGMFKSCHLLDDFDFNALNTRNVTDMSEMFLDYPSNFNYQSLGFILNLSDWQTDNVTDFSSMFNRCMASYLDISSFVTAKATDMSSMFSNCSQLRSLDVSHFNTENVTDMSSMFSNCSQLRSLDVSHFNTENVTDMSSMFSVSGYTPWLTSLDVSGFNTDKVTTMSHMFAGQMLLTRLDVSNFSAASLSDMSYMFSECESLAKVYMFDIPRNKGERVNVSGLFLSCSELRRIYVDEGWNQNRLIDEDVFDRYGVDMFEYCDKLVGGMGTTYDDLHAGSAYFIIDEGGSRPGYLTDVALSADDPLPVEISAYARFSDDGNILTLFGAADPLHNEHLEGYIVGIYDHHGKSEDFIRLWPRPEVTEIVIDDSFSGITPMTSLSGMFMDFGCVKEILGLENIHTDNVKSFSNMFANCYSLEELDLSSFSTDKLTRVNAMFFGCWSLKRIVVETPWNLDNLERLNDSDGNTLGDAMFYGCKKLVGGMGTRYDDSHVDSDYARIDGGADSPGYFSTKEQIAVGICHPAPSAIDSHLFDLQGRRVGAQPRPGFYIQDGRKHIVR